MIINDLRQALAAARRERTAHVAFLATLLAEVQKVGKNNGNRETTDDEAVKVLKKVKQGNDELIRMAADRDDVRAKATAENEVIAKFLPRQLTPAELDQAIRQIILEHQLTSPKGLGVVMKQLQAKFAGLYDGKQASALAKQLLG